MLTGVKFYIAIALFSATLFINSLDGDLAYDDRLVKLFLIFSFLSLTTHCPDFYSFIVVNLHGIRVKRKEEKYKERKWVGNNAVDERGKRA